jgi:hypothetical protein
MRAVASPILGSGDPRDASPASRSRPRCGTRPASDRPQAEGGGGPAGQGLCPGPPGGIAGLAGAFPLPNTAGLLVGTAEHSTTIITFLYFQPGTSFSQQTAGANKYARWYLNQPADHVVGVTGPIPAEYAQSRCSSSCCSG